jgi:hypothetical protein
VPRVEVAEQAGVGLDGSPRPSEDVVVVRPNAVILLDGATSLRSGLRSGGWYARSLSQRIVERLDDTTSLTEILAGAIRALATEYDLTAGRAPSSTVALLRWTASTVDALVLGDSPVVLFPNPAARSNAVKAEAPDTLTRSCAAKAEVPNTVNRAPSAEAEAEVLDKITRLRAADAEVRAAVVVADNRLASVPRRGSYRNLLRGGGGYGAEHVAAVRTSGAALDQWRNIDGGFWVAEADPEAAAHAYTASLPLSTVDSVILASDGVSCGVDDYRIFPDWPAVLDLATRHGVRHVLDTVRAAERSDPDGKRWPRPKPHDDQAMVLVDFGRDRSS